MAGMKKVPGEMSCGSKTAARASQGWWEDRGGRQGRALACGQPSLKAKPSPFTADHLARPQSL